MNIELTISISDIIGWVIAILGFWFANHRITIIKQTQNNSNVKNAQMAGGDIINNSPPTFTGTNSDQSIKNLMNLTGYPENRAQLKEDYDKFRKGTLERAPKPLGASNQILNSIVSIHDPEKAQLIKYGYTESEIKAMRD